MQRTETSVQDLVAMVERGELMLPEMQRGYVWRATRVRDLLDSLYRGYPSGNILVWETDSAMPLRDMAVAQRESPFQGFKLLLDGQQRITSLSAIMRGQPVEVRGRKRPIDILFNLEHPDSMEEVLEVEDDDDNDPEGVDDDDTDEDVSIEERQQRLTFVVSSRRMAALPTWVSVSEVFKVDSDAPFLRKAGVTGFDDPRFEKYSHRLQTLRQVRNYMYSVQILERDLSYNEVTEVFVRVNSLGAKLRSSDLALAQITAKWRGALATFEEYAQRCGEEDFPVQIGTIIRALIVHTTGQCRFKTVTSLSIEDLKAGWERAMSGMTFAILFARNNAGVESPAILSSPYALITLSYFAEQAGGQLSPDEANRLKLWLQIANGRGRYSRGSSETYLDQDLNTVRSTKSAVGLVEAVRQQFGRLAFDLEEFAGRNQRASLFRLMFQALKAAGATDWKSNIQISVANFGSEHKLQFHHIFPKALLSGQYSKGEINDIANLAFIGGRLNRSIGAKKPKEYLAKILDTQGEAALTAQCVPLDQSLWEIDRYREFLTARRELLRIAVNDYLGPVQ